MKKILSMVVGILLIPSSLSAGQSVKIEPATSSGLKSSPVAITTVPTTVYKFVGYSTTGPATSTAVSVHLVDGSVADSETAGSQLLSIKDVSDSTDKPIVIDPGHPVKFDSGVYLNNSNAAGQVIYSTP